MSNFKVLILGNASASPTLSRNHTSQLISINDQYFLMDCGEGTQLRLREHKIKLQRINHIFISHLHGDHYLGLIGLMQTMHLLGRQSKLHIYCCGDIQEIITIHLKHSGGQLSYPVEYVRANAEKSSLTYEDDKVQIYSIPLKHKITCCGFLFKEKPKPRRINVETTKKYNVPKYYMNKLKLGEDYVTTEKEIIKNEELTHSPLPQLSYAFCSDTSYREEIIEIIEEVSLLYHEATFTEEHADRAKKTLHSTAKQAATIARKSKANRLIIGHFSNRYTDLNVLLDEAKLVFKNTDIADQGKWFDVSQPQ